VIVQYGGQTPLKLALDLERPMACPSSAPAPTASTSPRTASASRSCCTSWACASRPTAPRAPKPEALRWPQEIGYPLVVRPSYVLGGRAMEIVHERASDLERYMREAVQGQRRSRRCCSTVSSTTPSRSTSTASADGTDGNDVMIGGIMEHIEQAGVHSGDSACSLPPYSLSGEGLAGRTASARPR
jgi:carbamoyl-phosphate synthase large subunit